MGGTHLEKGPVKAVAYPGVVVQSEGLQAGEGQQSRLDRLLSLFQLYKRNYKS